MNTLMAPSPTWPGPYTLNGRIQQIGRPRDVYERPANQFVADFVGNTNFVEGTLHSVGPGFSLTVRDMIVTCSTWFSNCWYAT